MSKDGNEGTAPEGEEAQQDATASVGTPTTLDEVTTLRSRNAGLDAKVTELMKATQAAQDAAAAAAQKLADYESGKVQADEALRAQLQAKEAELAQVARDAALARIEAKYPETFAVLGEAAASLSVDQLAASEARFAGVPATVETKVPTPVGNSAARQPSQAKDPESMSSAELQAYMMQQFRGRDPQGNPI